MKNNRTEGKKSITASIVVPVFNVESELEELLNQIDFNYFKSFELIFVDDGSTDNSSDILRDFAATYPEENLQVIVKRNGGLSSARNIGLEKASGVYVWFVDADDLLNVSQLNNIIEVLSREKPDILQFNYTQFNDASNMTMDYYSQLKYTHLSSQEFASKLVKQEFGNFAWAHIVKRTIYIDNNIRFPEGVDFEDIATTYRLCCNSESIIYTDMVLYYYRQRSGSIMRTPNIKSMRDLLIVASMIEHDKQTNILQSDKQGLVEMVLSTAINRTFEGAQNSEVKRIRKQGEKMYLFSDFENVKYRRRKIIIKKVLIKLTVYDFVKRVKLFVGRTPA
ncbi:glycosyltransferase [Lacticaseibacillus hulanensis]|uniref:glycosyltransferase n=1 Tax=Lacticaseibacillus hulanensis TaxID=2493111 RepID=UPI000FD8EB03|nr:glycosyltransferase [Lacticaseibacillus hulanensis]